MSPIKLCRDRRMGTQFSDLPAWEFLIVTNSSGSTYTVRAVRDGGVVGEMNGEDLDDLLDRARNWAHAVDIGILIREAVAAVEPLIGRAFRAAGGRPPLGSALDQFGLADGGEIVLDYVTHGECDLALDHLLYMIVEPSLPIDASTLEILQQIAARLGTDDKELEEARRLAGL